MNWIDFVNNVQVWAKDRGIYEHSTPEAQLLKALSELGELADAVIKNEHGGLVDGVGDVAVCIVNYSKMAGIDVNDGFIEAASETDVDKKNQTEIFGAMSSAIGGILCPTKPDGSDNFLVHMVLLGLARLSRLYKVDFMECCEQAWNAIKDRKGRIVAGGAFVKDESQDNENQAQQEPIAWLNEETGDVISSELKDDAPEMLKGYDVPLYRRPCFSCKGKLDSLNAPTEAVEALDAIIEQCEKVSNRLGIEDHEQAVLDGELTLANALRASAWELSLIGTLAKNLKERIPEKSIEQHRAEFLEHWDYIHSHGLDGGWEAVAWAAWQAARGLKP